VRRKQIDIISALKAAAVPAPVHRLVHLERVDCVPEGYLRDRDARDGTGHLPALMRPVIARIINAVCMENNWKPF
jgi:hypothetical protein